MTPQDITAIAAVVIACFSIGITLWQLAVQRRHNRLSVRPHLVFRREINSTKTARITLENHGTGPAFITDYKVLLDNNEININEPAKWFNLIMKLDIPPKKVFGLCPDTKMAISPSESALILDVILEDKGGISNKLFTQQIKRIDILVEFISSYKERDSCRLNSD